MTQEAIQLSTTPPYPGLAMVQDANGALATIASDFAGGTDPAAFAGPNMTWADTNNNLLKRRNAAGTEWVTISPLFDELATKSSLEGRLPIFASGSIPSEDVGPIYVSPYGEMEWDDGAGFYIARLCGVIFPFAGGAVPQWGLKCNFGAVSRSTYRGLFYRIGTVHGAGNGTTTFNVPERRGEFIRGWDDGRGVDSGRVRGSSQNATSILAAPAALSTGGAAVLSAQEIDSSAAGGSPALSYTSGGASPVTRFTVRPRNYADQFIIHI